MRHLCRAQDDKGSPIQVQDRESGIVESREDTRLNSRPGLNMTKTAGRSVPGCHVNHTFPGFDQSDSVPTPSAAAVDLVIEKTKENAVKIAACVVAAVVAKFGGPAIVRIWSWMRDAHAIWRGTKEGREVVQENIPSPNQRVTTDFTYTKTVEKHVHDVLKGDLTQVSCPGLICDLPTL